MALILPSSYHKISAVERNQISWIEPELAERIVSKVANAVQIPVTVKTRLSSYQDEPSDPMNFALRMQDAGAQMITLHGRTKEQGFKGKADWAAIAKVNFI